MPDPCNPPPGTPAGTACWLRKDLSPARARHIEAKWTGTLWIAGSVFLGQPRDAEWTPEQMSGAGWRFVRVIGDSREGGREK